MKLTEREKLVALCTVMGFSFFIDGRLYDHAEVAAGVSLRTTKFVLMDDDSHSHMIPGNVFFFNSIASALKGLATCRE